MLRTRTLGRVTANLLYASRSSALRLHSRQLFIYAYFTPNGSALVGERFRRIYRICLDIVHRSAPFKNYRLASKKKMPASNKTNNPEEPQQQPNPNFWMLAVAGGVGIVILTTLFNLISNPGKEIDWQQFKGSILANPETIEKLVVSGNNVEVYLKNSSDRVKTPSFFFTIGNPATFERKLEKAQEDMKLDPFQYVNVEYRKSESALRDVLPHALFILVFVAVLGAFTMFARRGSSRFFETGSKATLVTKYMKPGVTFSDVAGLDEAKQEIMEFVSFLKSPEKYQRLGAKIPKGALLVGPPGTGKTLLAKATAGEAGVPFFTISGSDFTELFAGVGPSRVRNLFKEARENTPCIIFIDEIDAVGRKRSNSGFRNEERENTLNQLLVEMDGFDTTTGVVVLAGTNRADVLDSALLRPGRFDRQVSVDLPDIKGRNAIFKVHLKPLKLQQPIDAYSEKLAALTPGFSGADIANICNEAALIAARKQHTAVDTPDFEQAIERVIGGLEKKNRVLSAAERTTVAYHEAGHAVVSWFCRHADPLLKVSIIPRGVAALGYAMYQPKDQYLYTKEQLFDKMCAMLGGRAAENVVFNRITTGAQDDLRKVTKLAYSQVTVYGMNEQVGMLSFPPNKDEFAVDNPYSQATARLVDEEVRKIIKAAYERTERLLREKRQGLEKVARQLLRKEVIQFEDLEIYLGKRPFETLRTYEQLTHGQ